MDLREHWNVTFYYGRKVVCRTTVFALWETAVAEAAMSRPFQTGIFMFNGYRVSAVDRS